MYNFLIRLVPPYLYEADAWFSLIRRLKYTKIVLITSQDEESRMVASRFQMLTDDSEIQVGMLFIRSFIFLLKFCDRLNEWKNTIPKRTLLRLYRI